MVTYQELQGDPRRCVALTGLSPAEFDLLLTAFARCVERLYPADRTAAGRPRQRWPGVGHPVAPTGMCRGNDVCASQCGLPRPTQDSLPAAGQALPDGLSTRKVPMKGFRAASYISSSLPKLSWRNR